MLLGGRRMGVAAAIAAWSVGCVATHGPPATPVAQVADTTGATGVAPVPPAPPASPAPPGPGEWNTWSHAKKLAYMRSTVLGEEQKVFAAYEPHRYRSLACRDCHGSGVEDGSFRMPNPDLPKLCGGPECFKELVEKEPEVLRFMQQRVVPETARLLGVPAFEFEKHVGFSCFQCHTRTEGR